MPGLEPPIIQPVAQTYTAELSRLLISAISVTKAKQFQLTAHVVQMGKTKMQTALVEKHLTYLLTYLLTYSLHGAGYSLKS
jgi:hypothetical protein